MRLFHGSTQIVEKPEIRISRFNKDFYFGFYCTSIEEQSIRWATRFGAGFVNTYEYREDPCLKVLRFEKMTDDTIFNYVQRVSNPPNLFLHREIPDFTNLHFRKASP